MRYRGRKNYSNNELLEVGVLTDASKISLGKYDKLILEIGAGRGNFAINLALENPNYLIVALEKSAAFVRMIAIKRNELALKNLLVIKDDADRLIEWFNSSSVDVICLNFSDPWPKLRQHKRRLTYPRYLKIYNEILKVGGKLKFRTDHLTFFIDSLDYLERFFNIYYVDFDFPKTDIMTEYEMAKRKKKIKINKVIAEKIND